MMKAKWLIFIAAAFLFEILPMRDSLADYYHYVDAKGVVHLTNAPTSARFRWFMREGRVFSGEKRENHNYDGIIREAAERYGVEASLVKAIIKTESDFDPYAVSSDGATGLMQLMPETAALMGVKDLNDAVENINGGVKFFKRLLTRFDDDVKLALAAYNAGENIIIKYNDIPPYPETRRYVEKVLDYHKIYRKSI